VHDSYKSYSAIFEALRFATHVNGEWNHFVTVVIPTKGIETLKLNQKKVDKKLFRPVGITRYSIGSILVPYGTHSIEAAVPFGMYSYGFGYGKDSFDAYGTMGGQSFIEYEAANDTLAPMAESRPFGSNNVKMILRDDREDDTGILEVEIIENQVFRGLSKVFLGVPQLEIDLKTTSNILVSWFMKVTDFSLEHCIYPLLPDESKNRIL